MSSCFNPSLHGRYSGSTFFGPHRPQHGQFQSISSWKVLWKAIRHGIPRSCGKCFNPSLHGRYSGREFLKSKYLGIDLSFNPSLHGRYSGSDPWLLIYCTQETFQSISSWKVLWKWHAPRPATWWRRVSIHLFMEGTLEDGRGRPFDSVQFGVSIHLFMEGTLEDTNRGRASFQNSRFNPSLHGRYSGSRSAT